MINIFSTFMGILLFIELLIFLSLLKPIREPYFFRDCWYKLQESSASPVRIFMGITLSLFFSAFFDITYEKYYYGDLLNSVNDQNLIFEFYMSKISTCYICLLMALYLLILIERLTQFLILVAKLLEFELMCRHTILIIEQTMNGLSSTRGGSTDINSWINIAKKKN